MEFTTTKDMGAAAPLFPYGFPQGSGHGGQSLHVIISGGGKFHTIISLFFIKIL